MDSLIRPETQQVLRREGFFSLPWFADRRPEDREAGIDRATVVLTLSVHISICVKMKDHLVTPEYVLQTGDTSVTLKGREALLAAVENQNGTEEGRVAWIRVTRAFEDAVRYGQVQDLPPPLD